jgi:hypothetical protein
MKRALYCAIAFSWLASAYLLAAAPGRLQQQKNKSEPAPAQASPGSNNDGEKAFRTNCGRCHNPPEDLSPREARAVVRQMRVRAMLSAEDEKRILQYLAP